MNKKEGEIMKILLSALIIAILFGGCASSTQKIHSKKDIQIINVRAIKVGTDLLFYNKDHLSRLNDAKHVAFGQEMKALMKDLNIAYKYKNRSGKIVTAFRSIDSQRMNYKHKNISVTNVSFNPQKKYYTLSGKYKYYDQVAQVNRTFVFIIKTLKGSKSPEGIFLKPGTSFEKIHSSIHGNFIAIEESNKLKILHLDKMQAQNFPKTKYIISRGIKASPNAAYVAVTLEEKKNQKLAIALYDVSSHKIINIFDFASNGKYKTRSIAFDFSNDERYFIFKAPGKNFQVYDIVQQKVVDSFGKSRSWDTSASVVGVSGFILASFGGSYQDNYERKAYIYDMKKREIFCEPNTGFVDSNLYYINEKKLHEIAHIASHRIYNMEKNNCLKVYDNFLDSFMEAGSVRGKQPFIKNGTYYTFKNGDIVKHVTFKDIDVDTKKVVIVQSLQNAKRLLSAGFDKKGFSKLSKLLQNDMEYFEKYYTQVRDILPSKNKPVYEAYFNALAFKEYIRQGKTADNSYFEQAARNYAWFGTAFGYEKLLPSFIETYTQAIGQNPSKFQQDMLAIYKAMYLLAAKKDNEAYELLFAANPVDKNAIKAVVKMSVFDMPLYKNRKKLAVSLGIDTGDFKESVGQMYFKKQTTYFYDLNGEKVKRNAKP